MGVSKQRTRMAVWAALERAGVTPADAIGRIPDFSGSRIAADRIRRPDVWDGARIVVVTPDDPQLHVREFVLASGKILCMPVPAPAAARPFVILDPAALTVAVSRAADADTAARIGRPADPGQVGFIGLVVAGSVAVDRAGNRIGKGAGYFDLEVALLAEAGAIGPETVIATTVHPLQIVDGHLAYEAYDATVDLIVTPDGTSASTTRRRPTGVDWSILPAERIGEIPYLARRVDRP